MVIRERKQTDSSNVSSSD